MSLALICLAILGVVIWRSNERTMILIVALAVLVMSQTPIAQTIRNAVIGGVQSTDKSVTGVTGNVG